jgi:predicted dehydrogenase
MRSGKKYHMSNKNKIKLGIIGCGSVSEMYLDYLTKQKGVCLYACADLDLDLAKKVAEKYGIAKAVKADELIGDEEVDIILNLTNPMSHFDINLAVLQNKKALFCEKPFALNVNDADRLIELAKSNECLFYAAPDTQDSRAFDAIRSFLASGAAGKPLSVNIVSTCNPIENWHPNPDFFYRKGAGPLFDRGVYYLTALVSLFGQVESVSCYSATHIRERQYNKPDGSTRKIAVDVPTHYTVLLKFTDGVTATMIISLDAKPYPEATDMMDIYCSDTVIKAPTPMEYGGISKAYDYNLKKWVNINKFGKGVFAKGDVRGVAVMEMVKEYKSDKLQYDNISSARHVIKVMNAIEKSGSTGEKILI